MLSVSNGYDVKYLTDAVATGRESYYTDASVAGEPAGLWHGAGAEALGLAGEVDAELMEAVYSCLLDPRDPATRTRATWGQAAALASGHRKYRSVQDIYADKLAAEPDAGPERRERLRAAAEQSARQPVAFIDCTFSAPKSISVLGVAFQRAADVARAEGDHEMAAVYAAYHKAVEDAVMAGAQASVDYLQDQAGYSRVGHHGGKAGRWIDAHEFVVAQFLQHDSRDLDPQLHVHNAILNRIRCADGTWRALDTQAIKVHRPAAAVIGERTMECYLTGAIPLRLATRPDGKAREVLGVAQEVMDGFSSRSYAISAKAGKLIDEYCARTGRELSALQRYRIAQRATLATRAPKSHDSETTDERLDRWAAEADAKREGGLDAIVREVLEMGQRDAPVSEWSLRDVMTRALAAVGESRQTWHKADLIRHVAEALPANLGIGPEEVRPLIESITEELMRLKLAVGLRPEELTDDLPAGYLLANGDSAFARPGSMLYATHDQIAAERALRAAAVQRGAVAFTVEQANASISRFAESGAELGADQAAVVRGVMTSGARLEILAAPAGTGKSFTVGALNDVWRGAARQVFGLSAWQAGTEVLTEEGLTARNVTQWLNTQRRLDKASGGSDPGGDEEWRLRPGDLVVLDEAGTIDTASLAEVHRRCDAAGAKLLLVGDPKQLAPVGPGGALADLAERGLRYELTEVRRFHAEWEGPASLRLREGQADVLGEYAKHGRIVDGGTVEQTETAVARAWLADTLAGRESLVIVPTNRAAARLSAQLRAELVALGQVQELGVPLGMDGNVAGVGDLVQARTNDWSMIGYEGNTAAPVNRKCYRVLRTREDGGLVVARVLGRADGVEQLGHVLTLPQGYVSEHMTLAYASTVNAAQGRTVDTGHGIASKGVDAGGVYVMTSRGRESNMVYCVTHEASPDAAPGEVAAAQRRSAIAVLADAIKREDATESELGALAFREHAQEDAKSVAHLDRLAGRVAEVTAGRIGAALDQLTAAGVLPEAHRVALAADEDFGSVERLLRRAELAGHDPAAVLHDALADRSLAGSRSVGRVLYDRIDRRLRDQMTPRLTSYADLIPVGVPEDQRQMLDRRASAADDRRRELGARVAQNPPQWALETLGPVPGDVVNREEWEHRAGWAAAWREWADHHDDADALGAAPAGNQPEKYAAWATALTALRLADRSTAEQDMSEGRLRMRARAMERETEWVPRWVDDELNAANQAAGQARIQAQLSTARADVAQDDAERARLRAEAVSSARRAAELAERVATLEEADRARSRWFVHTTPTRQVAERAKAELGARGVALDDPDDQVTAEEWLAAHRGDQLAEDTVRPISEADLHDPVREDTHRALGAPAKDAAETVVPDIRDTSVRDATEDTDAARRQRVPTAAETNASIARAQTALAEITARREAEAARLAEEDSRREQLNRWHQHDQTTQAQRADDDDLARQS